tara:strand:- start:271 stop:582 length:312 start_codon:yes stop_codon:yes gene_type:complete
LVQNVQTIVLGTANATVVTACVNWTGWEKNVTCQLCVLETAVVMVYVHINSVFVIRVTMVPLVLFIPVVCRETANQIATAKEHVNMDNVFVPMVTMEMRVKLI